MRETKYRAKNSDEETQIQIESIKVFCPNCGKEAHLIWSVANGYHYASWHCPSLPGSDTCGWHTSDPEPFREKPQRFKNLFDF